MDGNFVRLIVVFVVSVAFARGENYTRSFARSFAAPADKVELNVTRGVIEVANAPEGNAVRFEVVLAVQDKKGTDRTWAERLTPDLLAPLKRSVDSAFESMEPRYKADAKQVKITVRDSRPIVVDEDLALQMTINVRVTVPKGARVVIRTVAAGVNTDNFDGSMEIHGEQGSYFAKSISGDFWAKTYAGSITVDKIGGRATLSTASGNIFAGTLNGPAKLSTSNGSVEVLQAFDTLAVSGKDSEIMVGLSKPMPKAVDLRTSAGSITLNIDRNLPLTIDADTLLFGKVRSRGIAPVLRRNTLADSSMFADINGGGQSVRLRTQWGKILLVGRDPLDG